MLLALITMCRLHGIAVSDNAQYFYEHCDQTLQEVGMGHLKSRPLLRVVDGYKGKGYGISSEEELGNSGRILFSRMLPPFPPRPQPRPPSLPLFEFCVFLILFYILYTLLSLSGLEKFVENEVE